MLAKQALDCLSHSASPERQVFCFSCAGWGTQWVYKNSYIVSNMSYLN
jgi:hypothetical protein